MSRRDVLQAAATFSTALVTAATATMLFVGLCRLSIGHGAALAATLVYAFGTLAWPYSGSLYVQPVAAFGLAGLVLSAAAAADVTMACALAFLLAVRLEFIVLVPVLALHAWRFRRPAGAGLVSLLFGSAAGVGLNVLVNYCRGDPLFFGDYGDEAFSTPFWIGLHGVLFSSGKGLVWFAPAAVIGLALMVWLLRVEPRVGVLAAGASATMIIMVACWWTWHGGWSWGPRLLVPLMPILVLPLAWCFARWDQIAPGLRIALIVIIALSVGIQFWGVVTDPVGDRGAIWPLIGGNENESIYVPHVGPWGVEQPGGADILWCRLLRSEPTSRGSALTVVVTLGAIGCAAVAFLLRSVAIERHSLRAILPAMRPIEVFATAFSLILLAGPSVMEHILLQDAAARSQIPAERLPRNLRRLKSDESGMRLAGNLYIPIKGDYTFYQQGPPGTQFFLDGNALFQGPAERGVIVPGLDVGYHKFNVEARAVGQFNTIYWTVPGNAHYIEPIPRVYVAGPQLRVRDQTAVVLAHWRWLVCLAAVVVLLLAFALPAAPTATLE
jgi:hypothetical protein